MWAVEKAQALWKTRGAGGFSCDTCHSEPEDSFKTWAATMPKWEPRLDKVLGVEEFVTRHAQATTGADWLMETDDNRAMSVYLHYLANGAADRCRHRERARRKAAYARGEALANRKLGQLNFACTDCHGKSANHWIRGQWLGEQQRPVRSFPDLAHQPANDLGHPPALPVVPGQYPRRRTAAGRQGIWRSGALSCRAE